MQLTYDIPFQLELHCLWPVTVANKPTKHVVDTVATTLHAPYHHGLSVGFGNVVLYTSDWPLHLRLATCHCSNLTRNCSRHMVTQH